MLWGKKQEHFGLTPDTDPTSLCNVLMRLGWISKETLEHALNCKRDELIGQTLLEMKAITPIQLEEALHQQKAARRELTPRQAAEETLARQESLQNSVISGLKDLGEMARQATGQTSKIGQIKLSQVKRSK